MAVQIGENAFANGLNCALNLNQNIKQYKDSLTIVFPVYHATQNREAAKIIAVNYAGLEDWSTALVYLEKLMEQAAEIIILNMAAECYLNLSEPEKALPLLQKSLKLDPNQARIKELEEKTKKRLELAPEHEKGDIA